MTAIFATIAGAAWRFAPRCAEDLRREVTVEEVFAEVRKDELYYRNSGGGVTASGGEPLASPLLSRAFRALSGSGIHTTLDTCGLQGPAAIGRFCHYRLVLFD